MMITPAYEYVTTGFLFGIVFTVDIFGIIWVLYQLRHPKPKKAKHLSDLPRVYTWNDRRSK